MGDYSLLAGSPGDARDHYQTAADLARASSDFVWAGAALEGLAHARARAHSWPLPQTTTTGQWLLTRAAHWAGAARGPPGSRVGHLPRTEGDPQTSLCYLCRLEWDWIVFNGGCCRGAQADSSLWVGDADTGSRGGGGCAEARQRQQRPDMFAPAAGAQQSARHVPFEGKVA